MLPLDASCQAEYEDGHILDETEHGDVSPYDPQYNILRAILNKDPEAEHGKMVRFSVFYKDRRYDVDWRGLPDNARPIRAKYMHFSKNMGTGEEKTWCSGLKFGYQYNLPDGTNVKEEQEL